VDINELLSELNFKAVKSSGAGGQHANKVSSKVILNFRVSDSQALSINEKEILLKNLKSKLTKDRMLILNCDESRSQHKNKEIAIKRFIDLIQEGLIVPKKRKITKPSKSIAQKRLDEKNKQSELKISRKKPDLN